jgi:LSD1 subclass zinc finger protein
MEAPQVAHINCGGCGMTLMYAYGAQSVKCALCQFVTSIAMPSNNNMRLPLPAQRLSATGPPSNTPPASSTAPPPSHSNTVVVENPMTMDETGKLVSNVAVGVSTDRR